MKEILPKQQKRIEIPRHGEMQQAAVRVRRTLADLPLPTKQMNVISAICGYTLMGLSDYDIGVAIGLDADRVGRLKVSEAYTTLYDNVVKSIIDEEAADVRSLFAAHARNSAQQIVELGTDPDVNAAVRLKANQDILDRAGHRPVDVVQVHAKLDTTMKVVYVEDEDNAGAVIDGEAVQIDEG